MNTATRDAATGHRHASNDEREATEVRASRYLEVDKAVERGPIDALVAIASVGAIIWTGGLIVRQLYPTYLTINLQNGMVYAMFAAFASIAGLFLSGLTLQVTAYAFLLLYEYQYVKDLMYLYRLNAGLENVPENIPDHARYYEDVFASTLQEGFLLIPYPVVMFWPNQYSIAWVGFVTLFFGYQMMLGHLNTAKSDRLGAQASLTQSMGIFRIFQTLQDVLALLKQKL